MLRYLAISLVLVSFTAGGALRAATKPHASPASKTSLIWTNEDLELLSRIPGLISTAGQDTDQAPRDVDAPARQPKTKDPAWYAAQAASLNAQLETEEAELRDFTQGVDDAQELKNTTSGINLAEDEIGITPEATIDILKNRVSETQSELDALGDLARHNDIPPGILRDQRPGVPTETTVTTAEQSQRDKSARGGDL